MHEHQPARRLTGGVRLPPNKERSTAGRIRTGFVPKHVILSLQQGRGSAAKPIVAVGDRVLRNQTIATGDPGACADIHASTSGRVSAIEDRLVPFHNRLGTAPCLVIDADGRHDAADTDAIAWPEQPVGRLAAISRAGIVGLGGAAYPTARKLATEGCTTLVVNGAECEPYISCDDMLMREHAGEVVAGTSIMQDLIGAERSIIAIERDKPEAIEAMLAALGSADAPGITVAELPTIYPAGGERQLIEVLTGLEVRSGTFPGDSGFICQNVATARAVAMLAECGAPLTSRIVTVAGEAIAEPANVEVPIGTPICELIEHCGGLRAPLAALIHGGSMMGVALPSATLPVTKSTNCVIAAAAGELRADAAEWACIRCGECAIACPARLLPQDLLIAAREHNTRDLADLALADCIECGCCDVVCPSHIPLTSVFRQAKRDVAQSRRHAILSTQSARRFEQRSHRALAAEEEEAQRQAELRQRIDDPAGGQAEIAAAVERARRRRRRDTEPDA